METLKAAAQLRQQGISVEVYPAFDKLAKQFKYANQAKIPYVLLLGEEEAKSGQVSLKNMAIGDQRTISVKELKNLKF